VPPNWPRLLLPEVVLGAADDQTLFEANVRLQYSNDTRLLVPVLQVRREAIREVFFRFAFVVGSSMCFISGCI